MVGGINSYNNVLLQPGSNPLRDRNDAARSPASSPERAPEQSRDDLSTRAPASVESAPSPGSPDQIQRRIEARRAAEDVQLERFRADELPRSTSDALNTFAQVANGANEPSDILTGIDVRV